MLWAGGVTDTKGFSAHKGRGHGGTIAVRPNEVSDRVIGVAMQIHSEKGPGLFENLKPFVSLDAGTLTIQ
jgi:hypothetical protein